MKYIIPPFEEIFSMENLYIAWKEFQRGKKHKRDVADFSMKLVSNLLMLQRDVLSSEYKHSGYFHFKVNDPKSREIHKASVRDRVLHHVLYRALYPYFDCKFIYDSYSCRVGKGTHRAVNRFEDFGRKESKNYTKTVWILKCDIRKCFASVNHDILKSILEGYIKDKRLFQIIRSVIDSFNIYIMAEIKKGIPLGNLTSQLFINVYLHELDMYMKHKIKSKKYIRYADDFVIFSRDKNELQSNIGILGYFLKTKLDFDLHPKKIFIKRLSSGIDFLGWVNFPKYRVLRTASKRRMFGKLERNNSNMTKSSYLGLLTYGNTHKLQKLVLLRYGKDTHSKS